MSNKHNTMWIRTNSHLIRMVDRGELEAMGISFTAYTNARFENGQEVEAKLLDPDGFGKIHKFKAITNHDGYIEACLLD